MSAFYLLETLGDTNDDKLAMVDDYVAGLEMEDWKTKVGEPSAKEWPDDASIFLRKTRGRKLGDLVGTITNNLIVSPALRALIEAQTKGVKIEYLPVRIHDHRKRLLSDEYVIVNPLGTIDCLDLEASDILWDERDAKKALAVNTAVLSKKKVAKAPALFRIKEDPATYVISSDIADPVDEGDFANVSWTKLEIA